jgi:hypothetical protein
MLNKPSNAKWMGKAVLNGATATADFAQPDPNMALHPLPDVEIAWYDDGRAKVTFKDGCPAVIRQAYLSGQGRDLIVEFQRQ